MGWAARLKKTPGIKPNTESYKKRGKYSLSAQDYQLTQTTKWDPHLKKMVPTDKNPMIERRKIRTQVINTFEELQRFVLPAKDNENVPAKVD